MLPQIDVIIISPTAKGETHIGFCPFFVCVHLSYFKETRNEIPTTTPATD